VAAGLLVALRTAVAGGPGDAIFARALPARLVAGLPAGSNRVTVAG
jgi:hypothetical protein